MSASVSRYEQEESSLALTVVAGAGCRSRAAGAASRLSVGYRTEQSLKLKPQNGLEHGGAQPSLGEFAHPG